jgi:ATP-binding cassette subfamily B protein RaxB
MTTDSLTGLGQLFRKRHSITLQTEAAECGLACLTMVLAHHGHVTDLSVMRGRYPVSLKGATLVQLMSIAAKLDLASRAVTAEMDDLPLLRTPCVLHWNFNHYVVLAGIRGKHFVILDPAKGERLATAAEVSASFTGVALELWPNTEFRARKERQPLGLAEMFTGMKGVVGAMAQIGMLAIALELVGLVSPYFLKLVIDSVVVSHDQDFLVVLAVGFGTLALVQQLLTALRAWMLVYLSTSVNVQWRSNVFTHLLQLPIPFFQKRTLGDIVSRFSSLEQIQKTLTTSFVEAMLDGIMSLAILVMMFVFSPQLASVTVGVVAVSLAIRMLALYPQQKLATEQLVHSAKQQSHFLESVRGVKTLKLFVKQAERRSVWLTLLVNQINADIRAQRVSLAFRTINGVLFSLENIVVLALGANQVISGYFSLGALLAFVAYKVQFGSRITSLIDKAVEFRMLSVQTERLGDLVLTAPEAADQGDQGLSDALQYDIQIRGLSFRYSEFEPWILKDVDLHVASGESVAIVGPSGCGKTTLMNVVLGILPFQSGVVSIAGMTIQQLGLNGVRECIGTVLQDDVLFAGSIGENISFFAEQPDQAWIRECARRAAILSDIESMPMGFNTLVGDMGTVLSGGQKQRVLLARALYKRPKILFLDEATSHLDVATEQKVNDEIARMNITRILIAHRPETIASANRIVRLPNVSKGPLSLAS